MNKNLITSIYQQIDHIEAVLGEDEGFPGKLVCLKFLLDSVKELVIIDHPECCSKENLLELIESFAATLTKLFVREKDSTAINVPAEVDVLRIQFDTIVSCLESLPETNSNLSTDEDLSNILSNILSNLILLEKGLSAEDMMRGFDEQESVCLKLVEDMTSVCTKLSKDEKLEELEELQMAMVVFSMTVGVMMRFMGGEGRGAKEEFVKDSVSIIHNMIEIIEKTLAFVRGAK